MKLIFPSHLLRFAGIQILANWRIEEARIANPRQQFRFKAKDLCLEPKQ
jgi:hypothetical protein